MDVGSLSEEIWILGQSPLGDYIDFFRKNVIGGDQADLQAVCDEWRAANDRYEMLVRTERGLADKAERSALGPDLAALAAEVEFDPLFRNTFDIIPGTFETVQLELLVVAQTHVVRQHVERLKAEIGPSPSPEALFRFCMGLDRSPPETRVRRAGSGHYIFTSRSGDFRFHEAIQIRPEQLGNYRSFGPVSDVLGLVVGFGSPFLNVLRSDDRLFLDNGYHRAYALLELGITHAPCVVQNLTHSDELAMVTTGSVLDRPAFYFKSPRPPLLKDFFDPKLCKILPIARTETVIEVSFEVREYRVAD